MKGLFAILAFSVLAPIAASAAPVAPAGLYRDSAGHTLYVGVEHYLPDALSNETFEPRSRVLGSAVGSARLIRGIVESRRVLKTANGPLGVSLYSAGVQKRATVILIHGNDPEAREMGFLIPYFVCNGMNVISYDQRGTGDSTGNWFLSGPQQRAIDVEAAFDAYANNPHVDAKRFGLWGVSNGGWTAPIVAQARPVAFLILKSPPAESVSDNVRYEVKQRMQHDGFSNAAVAQAITTWNTMFGALDGTGSWDLAATQYKAASSQKWFTASAMPPGLRFPLPAAMVAGFKNAVSYDPTQTLPELKTPTVAFFGQL
nr:alpha/beta hydrolase [Candidatus Eremiobacteraeota bacterium]